MAWTVPIQGEDLPALLRAIARVYQDGVGVVQSLSYHIGTGKVRAEILTTRARVQEMATLVDNEDISPPWAWVQGRVGVEETVLQTVTEQVAQEDRMWALLAHLDRRSPPGTRLQIILHHPSVFLTELFGVDIAAAFGARDLVDGDAPARHVVLCFGTGTLIQDTTEAHTMEVIVDDLGGYEEAAPDPQPLPSQADQEYAAQTEAIWNARR
jgi:hypothetical protein